MTKLIDIDVALVENLIAAQYPKWKSLFLCPVEPQGWDNRTFRLGEQFAVRLPSAKRYAPQVEKEQRWLPVISPYLSLRVPKPVGAGMPTDIYPFHWSILEWIDGETLALDGPIDLGNLAADAAQFLSSLHKIDASRGPSAGVHNFFRGGGLEIYDHETRTALSALNQDIDATIVTKIWENALSSKWDRADVWVHGDFAPSNLLMKNGSLHSVIDFGCSGLGDPACDLVLAWTFLDHESRHVFRKGLQLDNATWARARGWALWKALLILTNQSEQKNSERPAAEVLKAIMADYSRLQ